MSRAACVLALPLLLLASGCSEAPPGRTAAVVAPVFDPDAKPGTTSFKGYYPLAIGNRWEYERKISLEFFPDNDASPPYWYDGPLLARATREIVGDVEQDGRAYRDMVYTVIEDDRPEKPFVSREFHRQDRAGHYLTFPPYEGDDEPELLARLEARVPVVTGRPSAGARRALVSLQERRAAFHRSISRVGQRALAAPGGPAAGEGVELAYPLHPGAAWVMWPVDNPFLITREVVGMDKLDLPIGRVQAVVIRHDLPEFFEPNDYATFWYGRDGFYGYHLHIESEWTDDSGERVGTYTGDESEMLSGMTLVAGAD